MVLLPVVLRLVAVRGSAGIQVGMDAMTNREIDALVAKKIMRRVICQCDHTKTVSPRFSAQTGDCLSCGSQLGGSYSTDPAASYAMEAAIPEAQRADYLGHLECACVPVVKFDEFDPSHVWALVHATPRQRCDAAIAMLEEG